MQVNVMFFFKLFNIVVNFGILKMETKTQDIEFNTQIMMTMKVETDTLKANHFRVYDLVLKSMGVEMSDFRSQFVYYTQ